MSVSSKVKSWLRENAPMLTKVYDNKYVEMLYDRYASLPPNQQKQVTMAGLGGAILIVVGYLVSSYLSLWSYSREIRNAQEMISLLQEYQRESSSRGGQMELLERSSRLSQQGAFKQHLLTQGRLAKISPRMLQVEETENAQGDGKGKQEIRIKQAKVTIQRANLHQLKSFLENIEFDRYNTSISSLTIKNDEKIRGYMNVEIGIVAYLFQPGEGA
ncbi:MAG: hypothetical protein KDA37_18820 [Planctomycetales bacterium]|nr:hypothetical protein [Planctomycetales bacterium]MCB0417706.1 hypothetical protein [Bdellovibrionales bacterium]MCB9253493.1 hypothetical protein [Pseudobdellovibrionaceae bacterium]